MDETICVIGAGGAGLAALKALSERGLAVECFESAVVVGGNWRYDDFPGRSAAYASLCCNVSRRRMQYPSFPMPRSYGDFPHHSQVAAYLAAYAEAFDLQRHVRFSSEVERIEPAARGGWRVRLCGGRVGHYRAVVVANGHHRKPIWPTLSGVPAVRMLHAHDYRTPDPFAAQRVLVIGAGQSAIEIATEVCRVAARTSVSVRGGVHVIPRYLLGLPFDSFDLHVLNRLPWPVLNWAVRRLVAVSLGRGAASKLGTPAHRVLEQIPTVSSELFSALRCGAISLRHEAKRCDGACVTFADGAREEVDVVICATGYRIDFPFLPRSLMEPRGRGVALYRRIAALDLSDLYFVGLVDPPSGLLPIVEAQSAWLGDVLDGSLRLPDRDAMRAAARAERRTAERFPREPIHSIRCDPHAYLRILNRDRRRARVRRLIGWWDKHGRFRRARLQHRDPFTAERTRIPST